MDIRRAGFEVKKEVMQNGKATIRKAIRIKKYWRNSE